MHEPHNYLRMNYLAQNIGSTEELEAPHEYIYDDLQLSDVRVLRGDELPQHQLLLQLLV